MTAQAQLSDRAATAGMVKTRPFNGNKIRVAIVGCGAIAQKMHLPVLAGHEEVELVALVDRDVQRAEKLAKGYGINKALPDSDPLDSALIDAAIVATPPFHHAPGSIELMRRGIHVLVEKPMALNLAEAEEMVRTAEENQVALSVGYFRRLFPSMRLLKSLLDSRWLGRPTGFHLEGGGMYNWEAATLGNMRKDLAGGGVLIDFGSHMLDLLFYLFDEPADILEYRDNALGGIEADCSLRMRLGHQKDHVEGTVELARTRNLDSFIRVDCERGRLVFQVTEPYRIAITPCNLELSDSKRAGSRTFTMQAKWDDIKESIFWGYDLFRNQIDDWLNAIRTGQPSRLSGRSALAASKLIDNCYRRPRPINEPWVKTWARDGQRKVVKVHGMEANGQQTNGTLNTVAKKRRVLITGATGFIGSRIAEILHLREGWDVRALVHNPGNASRLARLPIEMVQGDLRSEQEVRRLVDGCDAVVHCAIGTEWGKRKEIFAVTVDGTRRLAEAALATGARRFVHFSTISVYGDDGLITGTLDEATPVRPARGSDYGESKAAAEAVILRLAGKGLSAVIFRPARVFGPFSRIFINNPMVALAEGRFHWLGSPDVPCDMVYVDNLAEATFLALEAPTEKVIGETFAISDGNHMTWREFYAYFAEALGIDLSAVPADPPGGQQQANRFSALFRWPRAWYRGIRDVVGSPEFRALGRKVLQTDPLGTLPRWTLERVPWLERVLRRLLKADGSLPIYRREKAEPASIVHMGSAGALVNIEKAQRLLNYQPVVDRPLAMKLTLDWIRHAQLVK